MHVYRYNQYPTLYKELGKKYSNILHQYKRSVNLLEFPLCTGEVKLLYLLYIQLHHWMKI